MIKACNDNCIETILQVIIYRVHDILWSTINITCLTNDLELYFEVHQIKLVVSIACSLQDVYRTKTAMEALVK